MDQKKKFFGLIEYKSFFKKSLNEKLDWLIKSNILIEKFKKNKFFNSDLNVLKALMRLLLIRKNFFTIEYNGNQYEISDSLIEEIKNSLYHLYLERRDFDNELYYLKLEIRKKIDVEEKIKILKDCYENKISDVDRDDILDFLQDNNLYESDKKEFLKSDFNNDENLYDYDFIYYSIIYDNADFVFKYVFNENWNSEKMNFLFKLKDLYNKKKIINFCFSKLAELKSDSNSTNENSLINQKLTSNQIVLLIEEIRYIDDNVWENLHDTKKAELISYLTYFTKNTIREKLPNLKKKEKNLSKQESADLDLVQSILKKIVEGS